MFASEWRNSICCCLEAGFLECRIETGRISEVYDLTSQIWSIIGDFFEKYNMRHGEKTAETCQRVFLHQKKQRYWTFTVCQDQIQSCVVDRSTKSSQAILGHEMHEDQTSARIR